MRSFQSIYETAVLHKGSTKAVESMLPDIRTEAGLREQSNSYYLSEMSRRIFRAGLKHSMVDAKWPAFDEAFFGFDPYQVAMMSDEDLEAQMQNERIIRHFGKIKAVRGNAIWMIDVIREFGSFGNMLADWPVDNIVGLWQLLKKQGTQMGGQSGARFLRMVGKDTFLLTDDVVNVLKAEGVVEKMPTSQKDLAKVQQVFNQWQQESGRSMAEISRIVSFTTNSR
jgi:3-methyladenine DNA glycosylase Tag